MSKKIDQNDINNAAWAACDTFRGVLDPAQYKDYILVTLFLKYISDVWQDHYNEYQKQYGDDEQRIRRKLDRERFMLPKGASFYDLYEKRSEANIGELFNISLDAIEETNKSKLDGVFRNIDFNSEANLGKAKDRNRRLKMLLEDFNNEKLDMRPSRISGDVIGNTYIYLIKRFASDAGKKAGEFYTPLEVSRLVAKLARPKAGDKICDPSCGSGGLLIEAAMEVGNNNFALFGMEVNGSTWALAKMNMFLHDVDSARIEWCNTLTSPALVEQDQLMKFNVVVANPPFSLDKWGADEAESDRFNRFWRGVPPKSKGDWAFISHMVESALEKEGRVSVVVPHGVLFRGAAEGRIREKMIEENLLDAVVGLPGNLFPTTNIPVAILVFDKRRTLSKNTDVLFIDASRDFQSGKNQNMLRETDIEKILDTFINRKEIEKYSHIASFEEIKENDFNLNIPRYVDTFEEEAEIDIDAVQKEIIKLEDELEIIRKEMNDKLKEIIR
jgi:type I restriction enzyme M protein